MLIKLSQDRKVQGVKGERNSIGLPVVKSCPGATTECIAKCYAGRGMMTYPNARNMYEDNYKSIKMLLGLGTDDAANFLAEEIRSNNKSGIFRWNIGGDIFSVDYLHAIVLTAEITPDITHWVYTRSFDILNDYWVNAHGNPRVGLLIPRNLKINLSFDKGNVKARGLEKILKDILYTITWMGDKKDAQFYFPDRNWITCPELTGGVELQSACSKCKLCFGPYKKVRFTKDSIDMYASLGMPFTDRDKRDAVHFMNKEYGKKIGIHFPTVKSEGRK